MPEIHVGLIKYNPSAKPLYGMPFFEGAILRQNTVDGAVHRELSYLMTDKAETVDYEVKQSPRFWLEKVRELREKGEAIISSNENPLMTPSAGAISFFLDENGDRRYVSLCQKDAGAPRDPGFRVPRNGFPNGVFDWCHQGHLYREAFEEGIFLTRDGELLVPKSYTRTGASDEYWESVDTMRKVIERTAENLVSHTGLRIAGTREADIRFAGGRDTLRTAVIFMDDNLPAEGSVHKGVISWTPETGLNFIKPLDVNYPLEELLLVDGETFPDGKPICRDTCLIDLRELQGKLFGDIVNERVYKHDRKGNVTIEDHVAPFLCDKVPRSVLNQIEIDGKPVYPIDWMDESYEFLNSRAARVEASKIMYSTLEKKMKVKP